MKVPEAAVALGQKGGQARSVAKTEAARANGRKGGHPKGKLSHAEWNRRYAGKAWVLRGPKGVSYAFGARPPGGGWQDLDRRAVVNSPATEGGVRFRVSRAGRVLGVASGKKRGRVLSCQREALPK